MLFFLVVGLIFRTKIPVLVYLFYVLPVIKLLRKRIECASNYKSSPNSLITDIFERMCLLIVTQFSLISLLMSVVFITLSTKRV